MAIALTTEIEADSSPRSASEDDALPSGEIHSENKPFLRPKGDREWDYAVENKNKRSEKVGAKVGRVRLPESPGERRKSSSLENKQCMTMSKGTEKSSRQALRQRVKSWRTAKQDTGAAEASQGDSISSASADDAASSGSSKGSQDSSSASSSAGRAPSSFLSSEVVSDDPAQSGGMEDASNVGSSVRRERWHASVLQA